MLELYFGHLGKAILKDGSTQVAEFSISFLQAVYATFSIQQGKYLLAGDIIFRGHILDLVFFQKLNKTALYYYLFAFSLFLPLVWFVYSKSWRIIC